MSDYRSQLTQYAASLGRDLKDRYAIESNPYIESNVKKGLRNADGTGVIAGLTKVGSVQGYSIEDIDENSSSSDDDLIGDELSEFEYDSDADDEDIDDEE